MTSGEATRTSVRLGRWLGRLRLRPLVTVLAPAPTHQARSARRAALVAVAAGVLVFVAIQFALAGLSAFTRLVADPVYADKERRLRRLEHAAPSGAPRVILLGTSRAGYGLAAGQAQQAAREADTPAVVFNYGTPGAGPITHLLYLRRLLADNHRPDLLILEVLPPLLADLPDGPYESRLLGGDLLSLAEVEAVTAYGFPARSVRRQWVESAVIPVHAQRFKLVGRVFPSALPWQLRYEWGRTPDPNGWNPSAVLEVTPEQFARGVDSTLAEYRGVFRHELPGGPAATAIRDTLSLCRDGRIAVALVIFPETSAFRALYPAHTEANLARFFAEVNAEFGCPLLDARAWLPDDHFLDGHHLGHRGAEAFTRRLANELILPFLRDPNAWRARQ